jgi:hypothetical protein
MFFSPYLSFARRVLARLTNPFKQVISTQSAKVTNQEQSWQATQKAARLLPLAVRAASYCSSWWQLTNRAMAMGAIRQ